MWILVFVVLIVFNDSAFQYVTLKGVLIIFTHIFMVIGGYLVLTIGKIKTIKPSPFIFKLPINTLYYTLLFLTILGLFFLLSQISLVKALLNSQLQQLRGDLLSHEITIPKKTIIFSNFIYPLAIVTPLYSLLVKNKMRFLFISFIVFILYSLSTGGKGGIVNLTVLMIGAILYMKRQNIIQIDYRIKKYFLLIILIILAFIIFINYTRDSDLGNNNNVFITYFSNSVPAFCQLLNQKEWHLLSFNLNDHTITRTISGLFGHPLSWAMDKNIVFVPPNGFNVFTSFADSIFSLGLIGSLVYYFFIGVLMSYANRQTQRINRIFLFSILFSFTFFSFYVDIFYFMAGSWYCIVFYIFIGINPEKYLHNLTDNKNHSIRTEI